MFIQFTECDPVRLWELLPKSDPLASLAIHVLSFTPNSASCERIFSTMGNIKTKRRNRLTPQKTRDLAFIKLDVRRQQAIDGTLRKRLNRQFGSAPTGKGEDPSGSRLEEEELAQIACAQDDEDGSDPSSDEEDESCISEVQNSGIPNSGSITFQDTARQLAADIVADEDEDDVGEIGYEEESTNTTERQVCFFTHLLPAYPPLTTPILTESSVLLWKETTLQT